MSRWPCSAGAATVMNTPTRISGWTAEPPASGHPEFVASLGVTRP
jgi:hypothetical protein